MGLGSFNALYLKFIKLAAKFKFIKEMLLQEFMYKLSLYMQNQINFEIEYLDNTKDLALRCQKIYDQMLVIDWVKSNTKLANIKVANIPTRYFSSSSQITLSNISGYCPKPRNIIFLLTHNK